MLDRLDAIHLHPDEAVALSVDLRLAMIDAVRAALGTDPVVWRVGGREIRRERQVQPQQVFPLQREWRWGL